MKYCLFILIQIAALGVAHAKNSKKKPLKVPKGLVSVLTFESNTCVQNKKGEITFVSPIKDVPLAHLEGAMPTSGRAGSGMQFSGGGDVVQSPSYTKLDGASKLTISAWIKVRQFRGSNYVVAKEDWDRGSRGFVLRLKSSGEPEFAIGRGGTSWVTLLGEPITAGEWHHLAATYEPGYIRLIVDGKKRVQARFSGSMMASTVDLGIGHSTFSNRRGFSGTIDEVGIWNRVLSPEEIRTVYTMGQSGQPLLVSKRKPLSLWPAPTMQLEGEFNGVKSLTTKKGQLVAITWFDGSQMRPPSLAIRFGSELPLGPSRTIGLPKDVTGIGSVDFVIARDGTIHVIAGFLDEESWHGYSRLSKTGKRSTDWLNVDEALEMELNWETSPILMRSRDGLSLLAIGESDSGMIYLSARVGRSSFSPESSIPIPPRAFADTGNEGWLVPSPVGKAWVVSPRGKGLDWRDPLTGLASPCVTEIRLEDRKLMSVAVLIGRSGTAALAGLQREKSSDDILFVCSGKPGKKLSKPRSLKVKCPFGAFTLVEHPKSRTIYLVALTEAKKSLFGCDRHLEVWRVGSRPKLESRWLVDSGDAWSLSATCASDGKIHVIMAGPEGDFLTGYTWTPNE